MRIYILKILGEDSYGNSVYIPHSYWKSYRAAERMKTLLKPIHYECQNIESVDLEDEKWIDKYMTEES
jgi:hypothetical protein